MYFTNFRLYYFLIVSFSLLLWSCDDKQDTATNTTKPTGITVSQTNTSQPTEATDDAPAYCDRIEYRYFTKDIMPFTSNPCKHPVGPKCLWNQVQFHISGPSNNYYKLLKININEGANLTFGDCRTCRPNGEPQLTSDVVSALTICDGNEHTGVLEIEVKDKATGKVLGVCEKPFKLKVTPPCPAGAMGMLNTEGGN